MRCPDCSKFVAMNTDTDPEVNSLDVDNGDVSAEVRIVNCCDECGTELKDYTFNVEADISEALDAHLAACHDENDTPELEIEEGTSERSERFEGRGRKPRKFYGFVLEATVTCDCGHDVDADGNVVDGKWTHTLTLTDEVQASDMDELV